MVSDMAQPDTATPDRLAELIRQAGEQRYPPVHAWNPEHCGEIDIRIARDGSWHYQGSPIGRRRMVRLFASILKREGDDYYLVTPVEKLKIAVDDAPYVAVALERSGAGRAQTLALRTQTDELVIVDADHPIRVETDAETGEPSPYVHVRDGLEALITRPVYYELVEIALDATPEGETPGVWSRGAFFDLTGGGDADR